MIQALVREIVIKRDGGCILRNKRRCGGDVGFAVLQADHLITRANSATFADTRLIVCVCRSCHAWKSLGSNNRKAEYDTLVKTILPADRVALWERCERDSWKPVRTGVAGKEIVSALVKDAYAELKSLIKTRYPNVSLDQLEQMPQCEKRRAVVEEDFSTTAALEDTELADLARKLSELVQQKAPSAIDAIGVKLKDVEAANIRLAEIVSSGSGAVLENVRTSGDIDIRGVQAGQREGSKKTNIGS